MTFYISTKKASIYKEGAREMFRVEAYHQKPRQKGIHRGGRNALP